MAVTIGNWRFYSDATPDGSLVALAAENTVPTLTGAQTMGGVIRLRVQLVGDATGGSVALNAQHGVDGTNWKTWGTQSETGGNQWVRWANGTATASATVGSLLLSGSTTAGKYHEAGAVSETVGASQRVECDIALRNIWYPPRTTVRTRLQNSTTALAYEAGVTEIAVLSCLAVERAHTIDNAGTSASGGQSREIDYSAWPRMFHDGTYWWWLGVQPNVSSSSLQTWRWDGTGNEYGNWVKSSYNAGATISTSTEGDVRHAPNFKYIAGNPVALVALRPTSGNLRYLRGTFSSGAITWTNTDLGRASYASSGYPVHAAIDDNGYHWIGGFNSTTGVWACRTQTADTGGLFTPDFGVLDTRRKVVSDTITAAVDGTPCALMGLTSGKALMLWVNGGSLRWATVTDDGGFSVPATLGSTLLKSSHDWGLARSMDGAYVYVVYRDQTNISGDAGGDWVFWIYNVAANTWAQGPNAPRNAQNNNKDGVVVSVSENKVFAFGTGVGPGGNQDRPIQVCTFNGTDATGTWDATAAVISPTQRGNGDDIAGALQVGADGKIALGYLWGDNDVSGHPFTFEYFTINATTPSSSTTYYVDPAGSDTNDGKSTGAAWSTVAKVNAMALAAGDTVLFKKGATFTGTKLNITSSGTSTSPITISSYGTGNLPIFDGGGSDTVKGTMQPIELRGNWIVLDEVCAQHSLYSGIDIFGDDVTVQNCIVRNNPVGIEQDETAARTKILDNMITDNNIVLVGAGADDDSGAMGVLLHGANAEVARCTISGCRNASPDYGFDGAAIEIYGATNAVIHHNRCNDNRTFTELGHTSSANITYHHNIVWSTVPGDKGVVIQGAGTFGPVLGTVLHHNSIVLTGGSGSTDGTQAIVVGSGCNAVIRNNITVATWKPGYSGSVIDENYNLWYGIGGSIQHQIKSSNDLPDQLSYGDQSLQGDPQFVNIATGDLHLTASSPAINAGIGALGYTTDYDGATFAGNPDMGAYEYVSTSPPATPANLSAGAVSSSRIDLSWNASAGATSYDFERNGFIITNATSPRIDAGLTASTLYTYRLRAVNSYGASAWSSSVSATTLSGAGGGIVRRSFSQTENPVTTVTSHTVAKPAGAVAGDVLIVSVVLNGSSVNGVPTGWTTLYQATGTVTNPRGYAYLRVLTSADDAVSTYTWTSPVATLSSIGCDCLIGVDATTPLDAAVTSVESSIAVASLDVPSITTVTNGAWLVSGYAINSSNVARVLTSPSGFTPVWDLAGKRQAYASAVIPSAGTSGVKTWTVDSTSASVAWMAALRPAAASTTTIVIDFYNGTSLVRQQIQKYDGTSLLNQQITKS